MEQMQTIEEQLKLYNDIGKPILMRNMIAENNKNLVHGALQNIGFNQFKVNEYNKNDYEELYQEGFIILLEAIENYKNEGHKFSSYFYKCILQIHRRKEDYNQDVSLDTPLKIDEDMVLGDTIEDEDTEQEFENAENNVIGEQIQGLLFDLLDNEELEVTFLKYGINQKLEEGKTNQEIAEILNIDDKKALNIWVRARDKIRRNYKIRKLYEEIQGINTYNSNSIVLFGGSRTNKTYSITEEAAISRLEKKEMLKNEIKNTLKLWNLHIV